MKSTKFILYLYSLIILLCSSCKDDFFVDREWVEEGLPAQISLSFKAEDRPIVSRAAVDEATESNVYNLHLFIFDEQNRAIFNKFYQEGDLDHADDMTSGTLLIKTTSTNNAHIIGVANINTTNVSTDYKLEEDLSLIKDLDELKAVVAKMQSQTVNRTNAFFMSGYAEKNNPAVGEDATSIDIPGDNSPLKVTLKLKRLDAKVTFNVTAQKPDDKSWTDFSFQPYEWRVCKTPEQSLLVEDKDRDYDDAAAIYYDSKFLPFETIVRDDNTALYSGGSFTFYMPENRKQYKQEITDNNYALREKRDGGNPVHDPNKPGQTYEPGNFTYANDNSTYVEMTGVLSYRDQANYLVSASVKYYIHLGYAKEDVNDYDTKRNVFYTYNVKIRGINDIEVEVTQSTPGDDPRPGYEGDVVYSSDKTYFLDAHYDRALLHINKDEISKMTWGVTTPYSSGIYSGTSEVPNSLADYKWIKFAINKDYNTDGKQYVKYPGDQNYAGGKNGPSGYDQHPDNARLLDVKQLIERLKAEAGNPNSTIFEDDRTVSVTAFIDEYVYVNDPRVPNATEDLTMWKTFTEANDRQMHLTNGQAQYSPDGNSSIVHSMYTFRQKSIRTIYNKEKAGLNTAWGLESIMEAVGNPNIAETGGGVRLKPGNVSGGGDDANGRQNSINMLANKNIKWTDVINVNEGGASLKDGYQTAVYACLTRNRDLNGNNIIEANEIRWYLAAINQLTEIFIGQYALDVDAHLFPENKASRPGSNENALYWHYTTSTSQSGGNPWILWSEEGAARSDLVTSNPSNKNGQYYAYRCIRNLGLDLDITDATPTPLITYEKQVDGTYLIDATNLSPKARRGYVSGVLPEHDDLSRSNLLYDKFLVNSRDNDIPAPTIQIDGLNRSWWENHLSWKDCISKEQEMNDYRLPNQRELLVMLNVLPKEEAWKTYTDKWGWPVTIYEISQKAMYMCKTSFSKAGQGHFGVSRESFRMNAQERTMGVLNSSSSDKGYIRGVKDYK